MLHEGDALALDRLRDEDARRAVVVLGELAERDRAGSRGRARRRSPRGSRMRGASPRGSRARGSPRSTGRTGARCGRRSRRGAPTRWCAAACSASQFCPSCSSPSPVITTTRPPRPRCRFAQAIPRAFEIPIPSEPEFASIPGTPTSGWPSRPPSRRSRRRRSAGITPSALSAAYNPGTSWPFEEKNTSRSGESNPSSTTFSSSHSRCATMSSELNVEPRCPEPARLTAVSALKRHMSARRASCASGSFPRAATRPNSSGGISSSRGTSVIVGPVDSALRVRPARASAPSAPRAPRRSRPARTAARTRSGGPGRERALRGRAPRHRR